MTQQVTILIAEDQAKTRDRLCEALRCSGFDVVAAKDGVDAAEILETRNVDLVLSDHLMPRMSGLKLLHSVRKAREIPVILYSAAASSDVVFRAGRLGAVHFLEYPFRIEEQLIPTINDALARRSGDGALETRRGAERLLGVSPAMCQARETIRRVASSATSVLIAGDTGTGKEVAARALHEESGRDPFCGLAVTELAESLLEAELFGHERGAFTGALESRPGLFEQADGGTLLLDEIGDAPLAMQAKLLRILENGEVRRVGATQSRRIDARLIFATHRDLALEVERGRFRHDLFYRLSQVAIHLPPLRERPEDLEPLLRHFLAELAARAQMAVPELTPEFVDAVEAHPWRGNARELRAVLQRILLWWDQESPLDPVHLAQARVPAGSELPCEDRQLCQRMLDAYERAGGNQEAARRQLGMSRGAWRHRWSRYGLGLTRRPRS